MEAGERPAKIRKIEGTTDLKQSSKNNADDVQDSGIQIGDERQDLPGSQENDLSNHEDGKADSNTGSAALSKSARKKLRKQQEWEAGRDFRKIKRKERRLAKRERLKLQKAEVEETGQVANDATKAKTLRPLSMPLTFLLDCGFDDLMLDKEIISISAQITRCYSGNRKAIYQPSLAISSFGGKLKTRFDTVLQQPQARWRPTQFEEEDFVAVAEKAKQQMREGQFANPNECPGLKTDADPSLEVGEIVYLTADSDETLEELRPYSVYIIGGIVDRNRHKGICYKRATDRGIKTAKLPIGNYMQMSSRAVLTTNHVYEIMLKWLETKDWGEAFMSVIPKRKGGVLKGGDLQGPNDGDQQIEDAALEGSDDGREVAIDASTDT